VRPQNFASPRNFALGEIIDASATFTSGFYEPMFRVQSPNLLYLAPDFGPASYLGFRSSGGSYGWLEVTWDQATAEFEILAAARAASQCAGGPGVGRGGLRPLAAVSGSGSGSGSGPPQPAYGWLVSTAAGDTASPVAPVSTASSAAWAVAMISLASA